MNRIVQAVNAMIANKDLITDVRPSVFSSSKELFFLYKKQYVWSIAKRPDENITLFYYPGVTAVEGLVAVTYWEDISMLSYRTEDIGTREGNASFQELYNIVAEKAFGMDKVLDDIIEGLDL